MTKCLRKLCPKAPSTSTPMARPRKLKSATDTGRLASVSWPTVRDGNWLCTRIIFPAAPLPSWFSPRGSAKASANSLETTVDPAPVSSTNEYGPCPSTNTGSKISACLLPASRNVTHASGRVCISALSFRFLSLSPQRRRRGVSPPGATKPRPSGSSFSSRRRSRPLRAAPQTLQRRFLSRLCSRNPSSTVVKSKLRSKTPLRDREGERVFGSAAWVVSSSLSQRIKTVLQCGRQILVLIPCDVRSLAEARSLTSNVLFIARCLDGREWNPLSLTLSLLGQKIAAQHVPLCTSRNHGVSKVNITKTRRGWTVGMKICCRCCEQKVDR